MLASKRFKSSQEVVAFLQGAEVKSGNAGTNTSGSPNLQDLTAGAFTGVVAGDAFRISGDATLYTVSTVTNANNIVLSANIPTAHTTDAKWRAFRGGVGESVLKFGSPTPDTLGQDHWVVYYEAINFNV